MNTETDTIARRSALRLRKIYGGDNIALETVERVINEEIAKESNEFDVMSFSICEAAPDLLDALERIVAFHERHGGENLPMIEQARAAIAKAKGDK